MISAPRSSGFCVYPFLWNLFLTSDLCFCQLNGPVNMDLYYYDGIWVWYVWFRVHLGNVRWSLMKDRDTRYNDVIMTTMASQITSLTIVYSTVYSDADQRKHQSSASLAFVWGMHRGRWIPGTKGQLRGKCFHLMTSSCGEWLSCVYAIVKIFKWDFT